MLLSNSQEFFLLFVCILMMIPFQVTSDIKVVGYLGGSKNESVEYLMVASSRSTDHTVDVQFTYRDTSTQNTTEIVTVYPYMVSEIPLSINSYNMTGTRIIKKSVEVRSNHTLDLRVFVTRGNYTEGFLPLRRRVLGSEYYVSTFCEFGGFCQFSITSTQNGQTEVYVKVPESVTDIVFCVGETKFHTNSETNFTLGPNESLLVESPHDLTGTHIVANRKVVVMAGSRDMNVNGTISHLIEQLLPVRIWGKNFIATSMNINQYGDIIQITSSQYNTRVEMSGFPFIELPEPGMTVKRRLDFGMTSTITSNYPIQVLQISGLWYSSTNITVASGVTDLTVAPGMTVLQAIEQFDDKYCVTCGVNKTSASVEMFSTSTIDIYRYADSTICLNEDDGTVVPYSSYGVYSANAFETEHITRVKSENGEKFGGTIRCENTGAIMPLGIAMESGSDCTTTVSSPTYNDGIDNDCDGQTDEDYCFENKLVTTHYSIGVSTSLDFHTENITGASVIKLRVQTCGTTTVQLLNEDGGLYLLRLSRAYMVGYSCVPNCKELDTVVVRSYYQYFTNCTEEIAFYWVRIMDDQVCANIGPIPDGNCNIAVLSTNYSGNLTKMKVGGLMQDANIWIDIDRPDCGRLESDWRCTDAITNCHEYESGVCSDPGYQDWVHENCRRFCGICTPDGYGRKFLVTNPTGATETLVTVRNATTNTFRYIAHSTTSQILEKQSSLTDGDGRIYEETLILGGYQPFAVIITDADAVVTALYRTTTPKLEKTFVVYPVDTYGTEYPVNIPGDDGYCDIIATEADTTLEIVQKGAPTVNENMELRTKINKEVITADGVAFKANRPFALFCGVTSTSWNQMLPLYSLGKHYVIPNVDPYNAFNIDTTVKVIATQDNTVIDHGDFGHTILFNRGAVTNIHVAFDGSKPYNITSSMPVSVGLLLKETTTLTLTYTVLPPIENFMDYPLAFSDFNSSVVYVDSKGIENEIWENTTSDNAIPKNQTFSLTIFLGYSDWVEGTSLVVNQTPSEMFYDLAEESLCRVTESVVGDGIDNDCDGLEDEDICYPEYGAPREDQDLDGGFGEDCYEEITGVSDINRPGEPHCSGKPIMPEVGRPDEECWKPCQCDCAWVQQLEYRMSLNPEEREEMNNAIIEEYQEDMKLDEDQLTSEVAKTQSASDTRPSSTTLGFSGILFAGAVLVLIVAVDAVTLFSYLCARSIRNQRQD